MNKNDFRYTAVSEAVNGCKPGNRLQNKLAIGVMALGLALSVDTTSAAGIWVNTLTPYTNPADGKCSLIEAIENANADSKVHSDCQKGNGADTIHLWRKNTYTLEKVHNTTSTGSNGLPAITSPVTINGKGATIERKRTTNRYHQVVPGFRFFEVEASGELMINDLTLTGGGYYIYAHSPGAYVSYYPSGPGGAIYNVGTLSINNSKIIENFSAGAIHNIGVASIEGTSFVKNSGDIAKTPIDNYGEMVFRHSIFKDNSNPARYNASGVQPGVITNRSNAKMELHNSTVTGSHNVLVNYGNMAINHSSIVNNTAFTGHYASRNVITNVGDLVLTNNLISGNPVRNKILDYNSYIRPNEHFVIDNQGTLTSNHNVFGHDGIAFTSLDLKLAPSFAKGFTPDPTDVVATIDGNTPTPLPKIMQTETDTTTYFPETVLDRVRPVIASNDGSTSTFALVPGSIAIDAASNTDCPATDQRGVERPQGSGCDIGAFELDTLIPPATQVCEVRLDYTPASCEGSVQVSALDQLKSYRDSNFGFENGKYKHLSITASLDTGDSVLDIESPCSISVKPGVGLKGSFVSVDGKDGVQLLWGSSIESTGAACVLSAEKSAILKGNHSIKARDLVVEAPLAAEIGWNSVVTTDGPTVIRSVSNDVLSRAEIKGRVQLEASTLIMKSAGRTAIGYQSTVTARDDIKMFSNRRFDQSLVSIDWRASVQAGNDLFLSSASIAKISSDTTVTVGNNLKMNARNNQSCLVGDTADITYASRSGNCADELP